MVVIPLLFSLKKQLSHGSCFENLSISPGPGGYKHDEGFVLPQLLRKNHLKKLSPQKDKNTDTTLKNPTHTALSTSPAALTQNQDSLSVIASQPKQLKLHPVQFITQKKLQNREEQLQCKKSFIQRKLTSRLRIWIKKQYL